eukprot:492778_1
MATNTEAIELIDTTNTAENISAATDEQKDEQKNEQKNEEKDKELIESASPFEFEKSLIHKKIEDDVHNILDENIGWRLKDEKYKIARKLKQKYPDISDKKMMELTNMDFTDLANAYNKRSALEDEELKNLIRRKSDRKLISKKYPLPVFSNKTWKMTTNSDGCLFFELIFVFAMLPFYLFAQTIFMFCYLVRGKLPVSGTTDLVLKDHFDVDIKGNHKENIKKRKDSSDVIIQDTLPTGFAVKNIFARERPSHTSCNDVMCCCCRGVKIYDYTKLVKQYKQKKQQQKITLRIMQRQRIIQRRWKDEIMAEEKKIDQDHVHNLQQVDENNRNEELTLRGKSYCDRTSCCCMCPTAWQIAPLLDVKKDGQSKAQQIWWTVGWFNNCAPYDMLSWCFSTKKEVEYHEAELNLLGKEMSRFKTCSLGTNPTKTMLFRLLLCFIISILYFLLWINAISCVWWVLFQDNILFYDLSKSKYDYDCVIEGVLPFGMFALTAVIISFWAAFRAKIKVPNVSKLERFKIHWFDFSDSTDDQIMRETVKFTTFMNNRSGHYTEHEMLKQIEEQTTSAKEFINVRESVFRQRVKERIKKSRLLRFRHDLNYQMSVRISVCVIISLLPIIYRLLSRDINVIQFDLMYIITSLVLSFTVNLLLFSFIDHQIFFTDQMDLFTFVLNDITHIIKWPDSKEDKEGQKQEEARKAKPRKFGFNTARMDKFKETTETADMDDDLLSVMDQDSLPYCNVLEHGNALAWVEMRSWMQGMIKGLLSKVDMLLILVIVLLFIDASAIIFLAANHNEYGNQQVVINGIIFGGIILLYLALLNMTPLLLHGPKLRKLQKRQVSSLEKQKLMATNIVNNETYFKQFKFRDKSGLWDGKLRQFAPQLGIGFLTSTIEVIKDGDFSAGVIGKASTNLFMKSTGLLAAAAFPAIIDSLFKGS